jgi:hypothetical protein
MPAKHITLINLAMRFSPIHQTIAYSSHNHIINFDLTKTYSHEYGRFF